MNISQQLAPFEPRQASFGRHQTFALRFGWLSKGFQELHKNSNLFREDEATVTLGVGKNMVEAIHYWLQAARIVEARSLQPTDLGALIFDEANGDPYLEDEGSLWLIHWLIASNAASATSFYWFFNHFHKPEFSVAELAEALHEFAQDMQSKVSKHTLKQDAALIPRMYVASADSQHTPLEDALDSPLALLDLLAPLPNKLYASPRLERPDLPPEILGVAVAELFEARRAEAIPISELLSSNGKFAAPGSVFRLSENGLLAKLEQLVRDYPNVLELRETAGLHQLYRLRPEPPTFFLKRYYTFQQLSRAA